MQSGCDYAPTIPAIEELVPFKASGKDDLSQAVIYEKEGQIDQAKQSYRQAMQGASTQVQAESARRYALILLQEQGGYTDDVLNLLSKAASQKDPQATLLLANYHVMLNDTYEAAIILEPIAQTYPPATDLLATLYHRHGRDSLAMFERAIAGYRGWIEEGKAQAHLPLAELYGNPQWPVYDAPKAVEHYQQAITYDDSHKAYGTLADMYYEGQGIAPDSAKAVEYYTVIAKAGDTHAILRLIEAYAPTGWHEPSEQDYAYWWEVLADTGEATAMRQTGLHYLRGTGVKKNRAKAKKWLSRAIKEDQTLTYPLIRQLYMSDSVYEQILSAHYASAAMKQGDVRARTFFLMEYVPSIRNASMMKQALRTLQVDPTLQTPELSYTLAKRYMALDMRQEGLDWLKQSASEGNIDAMQLLATYYRKGQYVVKDANTALRWYLKAASEGDSEAQYQVGLAYTHGLGVGKNQEKARYWLNKADGNGQDEAYKALLELESDYSSPNTDTP